MPIRDGDRMVQRGVGPEEHARQAGMLEHPFAADAPLERDLRFAVEANVRIGLNIKKHRRQRMRTMEKIARATQPIDDHLRKIRPVSPDGVRGAAPMFVAVMIAILKWPDAGLPSCLAEGFEIARDICTSNIFRPSSPRQVGGPTALEHGTELMGPSAVDFVDELERGTRMSPQASIVYDITMQEISEGLAEPLVTRGEMDARFGRGKWRPLPRHVIWQANKWRPIDDGKRAKTNALTTVSESVVCIPPEFLLVLSRGVEATFRQVTGQRPEWSKGIRMATEDWWKGFRQLAPTRKDRGLAVVAVQNPQTQNWEYSALRGLPFGLGSAVNQFNRLPALATAIARRVLYIMSGHYVDDNAALELEQLGYNGQEFFIRLLQDLIGIKLSDSKRQHMTTMAAFLGHIHDLTRLKTDGAVIYGPKPSMRANMEALITKALRENVMSSGAAAKVRGIGTWLDTGMAGRCCRGAMAALTARQHWEKDTRVTDNLRDCLRYLLAAVRQAPDRTVWLSAPARAPVIVYTDASDEKGEARIGGIVYKSGCKPHVFSYVVPEWLRKTWGPQRTIINQAELAGVPILAATMPDMLREQDVIWFIDNTSAESALVKAGSPTETMCRPALRAAAILAGLRARVWYEHVPSPDNPADVLSRDATDDPAVKANNTPSINM